MGIAPVSREVQKLGQTSESEKNSAWTKTFVVWKKVWTHHVTACFRDYSDVSGFYTVLYTDFSGFYTGLYIDFSGFYTGISGLYTDVSGYNGVIV